MSASLNPRLLAIIQRGYNIGIRIIDEFLAKSGVSNCSNFRETADVIAKIAFKMFLGVSAEVANLNAEGTIFSLIITENPFIEFVEIPPQYNGLLYCNILSGVIRGALEMVQLQVECKFLRDILRGDDATELRVELKGVLGNEMSEEYKDD